MRACHFTHLDNIPLLELPRALRALGFQQPALRGLQPLVHLFRLRHRAARDALRALDAALELLVRDALGAARIAPRELWDWLARVREAALGACMRAVCALRGAACNDRAQTCTALVAGMLSVRATKPARRACIGSLCAQLLPRLSIAHGLRIRRAVANDACCWHRRWREGRTVAAILRHLGCHLER